MQRIAEFEKVTYGQFRKAMQEEFPGTSETECAEMYEKLQLPTRATAGSAGYDFKAPFAFTLAPGGTIKIPTGICASIEDGWWLGCLPRSGLGFKYRIQLNNTMGVIDADYYFSDNEGHIFAKITNDSKDGKTVRIEQGDGFMQGIFIPYGITYSDNASRKRNGGMGSTDTKEKK